MAKDWNVDGHAIVADTPSDAYIAAARLYDYIPERVTEVTYFTIEELREGYDEIPDDERSDFDTYVEQMAELGLISPTAPIWGACGVAGCTTCLPLYNIINNPVKEG